MINLMYVLLMAMLALNVSSDVLNGFTLVDESLSKSTGNASKQNETLYNTLEASMAQNPEKTREWFERATIVKAESDTLFNLAERLKVRIAQKADGPNGDFSNLINREDLEAATYVMLAPGTGAGQELFDAITSYRETMLTMVNDSAQQEVIRTSLSTDVPNRDISLLKNW